MPQRMVCRSISRVGSPPRPAERWRHSPSSQRARDHKSRTINITEARRKNQNRKRVPHGQVHSRESRGGSGIGSLAAFDCGHDLIKKHHSHRCCVVNEKESEAFWRRQFRRIRASRNKFRAFNPRSKQTTSPSEKSVSDGLQIAKLPLAVKSIICPMNPQFSTVRNSCTVHGRHRAPVSKGTSTVQTTENSQNIIPETCDMKTSLF
jgi:hypothetical protein